MKSKKVLWALILVCLVIIAYSYSQQVLGTSSGTKIISDALSQRKDVYGITWSPNKTAVAYVQGDAQILEGQMFLWRVGDKEPSVINNVQGRICEFFWSPNSKYVITDLGTSAQRQGFIVSAKKLEKIAEVNYTGNPCWSPDSKLVAVGVVTPVEPLPPWELDGTVDLALYDIETGNLNVIEEGSHEVYYRPSSWESKGTLLYEKHNVNSGDVEKFTYSLKQ
jgi:Tol biopolymer transport system component